MDKGTVVHADDEIYSALKGNERNEPSSHEKTWWELKCLLLSERSRSEK